MRRFRRRRRRRSAQPARPSHADGPRPQDPARISRLPGLPRPADRTVSAPPWSRRNGGYSSRIRNTYAATRATQRSRPSTTSKIPRGYRVGEEQRHAREEDENPDQPGLVADAPGPVVRARGRVAPAAEKDADDDVVRDREEPRLHEHEAARQPLRIGDVEPRRVVGHVVERERRIAVGTECRVGVETRPARSTAALRR